MMKKALVSLILVVAISMVFAQATNLFFSEYIEGSSNNKALEIFNGTGATVDLSGYTVKIGSNGGTWHATNILHMTGTLPNNSVYVIANAAAAPAILNVADVTSTVTYFNGNDAVALFQDETMIDIIGVYMVDPGNGTGWEVAGVANATMNHTLIRKPSVTQGNLNWASVAGTNVDNSEWLVEVQDYFGDIGSHTFNPGSAEMAGTPTFNPPAGAYTQDFSLSMSSVTPGATIRYTLDGTEPIAGSTTYNNPIAINQNVTVKAKAWADGFDPSYTAVAEYVFPIAIQSLSELRQQTPDGSTVYMLPDTVILTFKQNFRHQKFVQDGQAAILIDDEPGVITSNYQIGDAITGLTGKLSMSFATLQFQPTLDPGAPASSGNDVHTPTVTIADLNSDIGVNQYQSRLVYITDVSFDNPSGDYTTVPAVNYAIHDATGAMSFRTSFYDLDYIGTPMHTGQFSIMGIIAHFQNTALITPRKLADFNPAVSNEDPTLSPAQVSLIGNYPNPFNPDTTIQFQMVNAAPAHVTIYNQKGQIVKNFAVQASQGINNLHWNGMDDSGQSVSSGVYYFRLKSGSYSSTKKMVLMK